MALDSLGTNLRAAFDKIKGALFVDDSLIQELIKDVQKALLAADVNVKLVFELTSSMKERISKERTPPGVSKKDHLINIVYGELVSFVGEEQRVLDTSHKPSFFLLVGLFGSGKTTTAGKLARYYKQRGQKVALVQTDTWRPAAFEQLKTLAEQAGVDFYGIKGGKDAIAIFDRYVDTYAEYDIVIVDSAGRDALSDDLIEEIARLKERVDPSESLLVISADLGQTAQRQAQSFKDAAGITGVVITKMDGTAKGGGALSACAIVGAPVVFIGTGEKMNALEPFNPKGFIGRLLGLGDLSGLLDRVQDAFSTQDVEDVQEKFMRGEFSLEDLISQMENMRKMGPLSKVLEMIPGMAQAKIPKEVLDVQEKNLVKWRFIVDSMTREERDEPEIVSTSRIARIGAGSGTQASDVRALLKQYRQSKKMMKMVKGKDPKKLEKMMQRFKG